MAEYVTMWQRKKPRFAIADAHEHLVVKPEDHWEIVAITREQAEREGFALPPGREMSPHLRREDIVQSVEHVPNVLDAFAAYLNVGVWELQTLIEHGEIAKRDFEAFLAKQT